MEKIAKFVVSSSKKVYLTHDDNTYELLEDDEVETNGQYRAWALANGDPKVNEALDEHEGERLIVLVPAEDPA